LGSQRLFLTLCTHCKEAFFVDASAVALVELHLLRTCRREQFAVLAYCFMPDHVHLLAIATSADADASRLVRVLKQTTAFHFRGRYERRLWQRSFFDRTLRSDDDLHRIVTYIVMNPVRANLVRSVGEYPFWGSAIYRRCEIVDFVESGPT
jgi:putative transposase